MTNPSRISGRFADLRGAGEMGLVAYLTAGDPTLDATEKFVLALASAGADVIELGVPFSDPVADGPVIQRASERALQSGTTLAGVLSLVKSLRAKTDVPLVLFSYFNPILQMGLKKFGDAAKAACADVHRRPPGTHCESIKWIPVLDLAHRRDRRKRSARRGIAGPRAARAPSHRPSHRHRIRYFATRARVAARGIGRCGGGGLGA